MTSPIEQLKNLLTKDEALRGLVLSIQDSQLNIATQRGLKHAPAIESILIGDTVVLFQGVATRVSDREVPIYYL